LAGRAFLLGLAASLFSCEWVFLMAAPPKWRGVLTFSAVALFGIALLWAKPVAPPRVKIGAVSLWLAFGFVMLAERALDSPFDSTLPWWFPLNYLGIIMAFLFGLNFASDPSHWRALFVLLSWFLGGSGLLYTFGAATSPDGSTPISSLSVGYPMAAVGTLGLAFFGSELFAAARVRPQALFGFACCALGVFGRIHKPMVVAGIGTLFVVIVVEARRTGARRVLRHSAIVILLAAAGVAAVDTVSGGSLRDGAAQIIVERYLHLPPDTSLSDAKGISVSDAISRLSGGRFNIWAESWERFQASPIVGSGFMQVSQTFGEPVPWHNVLLEIPIAVGAIGTIVIMVGLSWWAFMLRQTLPRRQTGEPRTAALGYLAGVAVLYNVSTGLVFLTVSYLVAFVLGATVSPRVRRMSLAFEKRGRALGLGATRARKNR
jgi:hypothetical protein